MRTQRNDGLDLLRALAATLVFATHLYHVFFLDWLGPIAAGGSSGIYMFFALSGYLLYRPFVIGVVDLRRYLVARAARIAPAYYLALGVFVALGMMPGVVANPGPALTFTANFLDRESIRNSGFGQSWTLGVEVAFYLALPFVARLRGPWLVAGVAGAFVVGTQLLLPDLGFWFWQAPAQAWAFGLGMLVARYQDRLRPLAWPALPIGLYLALAGIVALGGVYVALGASLLILWSVTVRPRIPGMAWPASLSYGVYIWHVAVGLQLYQHGLRGAALLATAVPLTVAIAWFSYRYVERPVMRWASRHRLDRPPSVVTPPRPVGFPALSSARRHLRDEAWPGSSSCALSARVAGLSVNSRDQEA